MFGVGLGELVIIAVVALIVLGPEKLPDLAKQVGKGLRELKRASNDLQNSLHEAMYADEIKDLREKYRPPNLAPALGNQPRDQISPESIAKAIASAAVGNSNKPADAAAAPVTAPADAQPAPVLAAPSVSQPASTVGATLAHDESNAPEPQATVIAPPRGQPS
jgi:Tat protein translocase TatB subunit